MLAAGGRSIDGRSIGCTSATASWSGPAEKVATDGVVESGASSVDDALVTARPRRSRSACRATR